MHRLLGEQTTSGVSIVPEQLPGRLVVVVQRDDQAHRFAATGDAKKENKKIK